MDCQNALTAGVCARTSYTTHAKPPFGAELMLRVVLGARILFFEPLGKIPQRIDRFFSITEQLRLNSNSNNLKP
jgi:hypothetical protein